ncbi:unnamed protein product [Didymodactylos carnosus]|uniref:Glu-AdT subunit B n=1 Tax=Didymodactylos carnosus TaxID=1234261 RepID=A0A8S2DCJ0_9BILA|nr:unnamed protein product [Didymodactylos carnosus]CAF3646421.1 unnamed protein product [Didymodactylos carnosus]
MSSRYEQYLNLNAITSLAPYTNEVIEGPLQGLVFFAKENFFTRELPATGSSLFLANFIPGIDAFAVSQLRAVGAVLAGKAAMDEFGLGGTGTFAATGPVLNPLDPKRIPGGSSSGSAALVAVGACDFALGTDTGDSVRKPAGYLGLFGFKPSYGAISRAGVMPFAPSLDHVGILAKQLSIIKKSFHALAEIDSRDFTSIKIEREVVLKKKLKIGYLQETFKELKGEYNRLFKEFLNQARNQGHEVIEFTFDRALLNALVPTYQAISYSEAFSCYANLTGVAFGERKSGNNFEQIALASRTAGLGPEIKRRFVIGSYATSINNLQSIYVKAKQVRRLIVEKAEQILNKCDFLIIPPADSIAPLIGDLNKVATHDFTDDSMLIANFGGFASLTFPYAIVDGMPWGLNATKLLTSTKMFSPAQNAYGAKLNSLIHRIDLAYPGTLPQPNAQAVRLAIRFGHALKMQIDNLLRFDRKHYFYPDLPKGYQITQQTYPICRDGELILSDGLIVKIERAHLEEDTAKLNTSTNGLSIDYNRAGVPLLEIVTAPCFNSSKQVAEYIKKIKMLAEFLEISDAKMEEGSMRCDVNISLAEPGAEQLGTRVELKNINSIANVTKAIEYEIKRQTKSIENKEVFEMETRR